MKIVIILILVVITNARDYFISFSLINKNGKITYLNFNCSKALTFTNSKKTYLFSLPLKKDIQTTCKIYQEKIIENLIKKEVYIYSNEILNKYLKSRIKLTFLPKRFDIIINNNSIDFYLKEEK